MSTSQANRSGTRFAFIAVVVACLCLYTIKRTADVAEQLARTNHAEATQLAFWRLCQGQSSAQQRSLDFTTLVSANNREWKSAALENLELAESNLSETVLTDASFRGTDFRGSDFSRAVLVRTGFELCDCTDVAFAESDLNQSSFFKARLDGGDFRSASLVAANLEQCSGQEVILIQANLTGAYLAMAKLERSDFTGADLAGANLTGATLTNSNLALANLQNAVLEDTDFTGSNWWRSRGLSAEQLTNLLQRFSDPEQYNAARQRDFVLWKRAFVRK